MTKPLGTQVAVNVHQWLTRPEMMDPLWRIINEAQIKLAFARATDSMARLNRTAARLMHKYKAHCATDVTGIATLVRFMFPSTKTRALVQIVRFLLISFPFYILVTSE